MKRKKSYNDTIVTEHPFTINGKVVGHIVHTQTITAQDAFNMKTLRRAFQLAIEASPNKFRTPIFTEEESNACQKKT